MGKKKRQCGGFAWRNSGRIEDCYAAVRIAARGSENAGFVYSNDGTAERCFSRSRVRGWKRSSGKSDNNKKKDGFLSLNTGVVRQSFFYVKDKKKKKDYRDSRLALCEKETKPDRLRDDLGWDFNVFQKKDVPEMGFREKTWQYPVFETRPEGSGAPKVIRIKSEDDLLEMIERVNRGEARAAHASYVLTKDLDFRGKKLEPIGSDSQHPFYGTFDGQGHVVGGFVIDAKKMPAAGFFGYLKGVAANVVVDCVVKGKDCPLVSAFCAVNEGEIHCCGAACEVNGQRCIGPFAVENKGLIERCYVSGAIRRELGWLWLILPLLLLFFAVLRNPVTEPPEYEPVLADAAIEPNKDDTGGTRNNTNKASYEVPKYMTFDKDTLTAKSDSSLIRNPDHGGNYDFVATMTMTDTSGVDVEVYESGRIPVGYHIDEITLTPPEGVTFKAGTYKATLTLTFYHHDTGEKGILNAQVPLEITFK